MQTCIDKVPDFDVLLKEKRFQEITDSAKNLQRQLFLDWTQDITQEFQKELLYLSAVLNYTSEGLKSKKLQFALLSLGVLMGTVESLEELCYEKIQSEQAVNRYHADAVTIKHLNQIVLALESHGIMTHTELSQFLNMKTSTLSEAMKRILKTGAVQADISGRYKLYALTDSGLRYGKELRKSGNELDQISFILSKLVELLQNAKTERERVFIKNKVRSVINSKEEVTIKPNDDVTFHVQSGKDNISTRISVTKTNEHAGKVHIAGYSKDICFLETLNNNLNDIGYKMNLEQHSELSPAI